MTAKTIIYTAVALAVIAPAMAADVFCAVCGGKIAPGQYLRDDKGDTYCSRACFEETLPKCAVCGGVVKDGLKDADGKTYCSRECFEETLPTCHMCGCPVASGVKFNNRELFCEKCAAKPKCFCCRLPCGDGVHFADGRLRCAECAATAVDDLSAAKILMDDVRRQMSSELGLRTGHHIDFNLIDVPGLKTISKHYDDTMELGVFLYERTETKIRETRGGVTKTRPGKSTERFSIRILNGMSREKFIEVAAHELAHDWMQEAFPDIGDLKVKEGWAEFVAASINEVYGNGHLNERMAHNRNPVYGDGYRMIKKIHDESGDDGLTEFLRQANGDEIPVSK